MISFHDEDEVAPDYSAMRKRPREVVFLDEFVRVAISYFRLDSFVCFTDHETRDVQRRVRFRLRGYRPDADKHYKLTGVGPSMGHALRDLLDQIAEEFGIDPETIP